MDYSRYSVEDFVLDKKFRQWVLSSDTEGNLFWHHWLQRYPGKKALLQEARVIVLKLPQINYGWNGQKEERLWQNIYLENLQTPNTPESPSSDTIPIHAEAVLGSPARERISTICPYQKISSIGASVLIIIGMGLAV